MNFFKKSQKKLALNTDNEILKKEYKKSEQNLKNAAILGDEKGLKKAMKAHEKIEYALLYKKTPESIGLKFIKDKDKLNKGDCICVVRNKNTNSIRLAKGAVSPMPYKNASQEIKNKYGKNVVYVIYYNSEEIIGYYQ